MKNIFLVLLVVLVLGAGGYWYMKNQSVPAIQPSESSQTTITPEAASAKEFAVEGGMYYFKPSEMRVKKGDTVKITLTSNEGMHDWVLDEFNAKTKKIKEGESDTVTFVADKVGTFEYYCSVGNHRAMGMVGKLVVE